MADLRAVGRPGLPVSMSRFVSRKVQQANTRRLAGVGRVGDAASILAQETAWANSPYLNSPAFLASQAAALQNECAVDPSSPSCLVAQSTGDINKGVNYGADTSYDLNTYCQQNVFNNTAFGDPLDTNSCNGATPKSQYLTAAGQIVGNPGSLVSTGGPQVLNAGGYYVSAGQGSGTQGGGPVMTVKPAPAPPPIPKAVNPTLPTVQTSNVTGASGGAGGALVNGQPAAGSNASASATAAAAVDYTPVLLGVAAIALLMMVSK
jgi:hypothetical protein